MNYSYGDIINLPRPISKTRPHMSVDARAAQFAPYAALSGHQDLVKTSENVAAIKTDIDHDIVIINLDSEI